MSSVEEPLGQGGGRRGRGGRGRLALVIAAMVVVVLVVAAVITWASLRTRGGPVEAVRDYVDLIAAGEVAEATRLVDPAGYSWGSFTSPSGPSASPDPPPTVDAGSPITSSDDVVLDPAGLTATAAKASERIVVTDVALHYDEETDVPVGTTVDVEVEYSLAGTFSSTTLRAERLDDTGFGFTRWRVVDPLLVPLVVQSNAPELGPALVGLVEEQHDDRVAVGAHPAVAVPTVIDLSGPGVEGASQRATLLYPGVYELSGTTSTYLEAAPKSVAVAEAVAASTSFADLGTTVQTALWFESTPALEERVTAEAEDFVASCFATPSAPAENCPTDLRLRSDFATDVVLASTPTLQYITGYQVEHPDGVAVEPPIRATFTTGRFEYTSDDGTRADEIFFLYAWIHPDGDDVTIEFRPEL